MSRSFKRPSRKQIVWEKTRGICAHCGRVTPAELRTIDHFVPQADDGGLDKRNLMPLCRKCNHDRGDMPVDPWEFYKYAPAWAKKACENYMRDWSDLHVNMAGEVL